MSDTHTDVRQGPPHEPETCKEAHVVLADILSRIGDKWTVMVVGVLSQGPLRYNQIFREIDGVSQRMLTLTLKNLERDGLVTRTMYPTIPPRVDYALTNRGQTLIEPLKVLAAWAKANQADIEASRVAFDTRPRDGWAA